MTMTGGYGMIYDNSTREYCGREGSPLKKMRIFIGSYGSGKSELSIRFALDAAREGRTLLIDLDMVNTYFRATDRKRELEAAGVELISPNYVSSNVETLSLPAKVMTAFDSDWDTVIFDVGGDAAGAKALGRFYGAFQAQEAPPEMYLVVNTRRPMAESPERVKQMIAELEAASRLAVTGLVNNTNLGVETGEAELPHGYAVLRAVSQETGLPVAFTAGKPELLAHFLRGGRDKTFIGTPIELVPCMHRDWDSFVKLGI